VVKDAEFSPDGNLVVTASFDKTARIWNAKTGQTLIILNGHTGEVHRAVFNFDGSRVVTASADNTARIWDAKIGKTLTILKGGGHDNGVQDAAFSPDGRHVVTASLLAPTVQIWDVDRAQPIGVLNDHKGPVEGAMFSSDGFRIVTASWDKTARIWNVFPTTQGLIEDTKRVVPRCLTPEQRRTFFLDAQPPAWCIEMEKWPYNGDDWKSWLAQKNAGQNPPLPGTGMSP
jgi:WD40 repeat protein